jgi:hypothetical protein
LIALALLELLRAGGLGPNVLDDGGVDLTGADELSATLGMGMNVNMMMMMMMMMMDMRI